MSAVRFFRLPAVCFLAAWTLGCSSGRAAPTREEPFDEQRAWTHLERIVGFGPRPAGSTALEELRGYLGSELAALGLTVVREDFTDRTPIGDVAFANLYADLPGATADAPIVVLATHIDTKRLPFRFVGASDGGSSTAVVLELARVLARTDRQRTVTYRFLFLDGEEAFRPDWAGDDNTYGSRHHVRKLVQEGEASRVRACILLDLVGDADLQLATDSNSTPWLLNLFFQTARDIGLGKHVGGRRQALLDDHLPFLRAGIPSVDLIDFTYGGPHNPYWHQAEDDLSKCSAQSLGAIGTIVAATLPKLEKRLAGS